MSVFTFGSGSLWGVSTASGVQTPINFGTLQEVSIETSFNTKELFGSKQFAVAVARGTGKVTGKAKFAQINGELYNSLFYGANLVTGQVLTAINEAKTIPNVTPWTATVTGAATFIDDLGVIYSATGLPLKKVATAPIAGQYSVSAVGVYTFAAADANLGVEIDYTYNDVTNGKKIVITNQLLGTTPFFSVYFSTIYNGKAVSYQLPKCTSSKLSFATKLEDFSVPEFDFSAFCDDSGKIMTISTAE